ncbi:hypothetical protein NpPPO83_00005973 [Neofusicoccum parvum]|uniref:Uncharacterized protein n=1 Tax=Neofusicoccum parvum TaxID=310453 RepID=A0ACB5RWE6_9PEZI|nr:hypothetical protein NpPPO83_00005973 [Neofusicoccum parvum]
MSITYSYNDLLVLKSKLFHRFVQRGGKIPADILDQQQVFYGELSLLTPLQVDMLLENKPVPLDAGTHVETVAAALDTPQSQQSAGPPSMPYRNAGKHALTSSTTDAALHRRSSAQSIWPGRSSTLSVNSTSSYRHHMSRYPNTYSSAAGNDSFSSISTPPQAATRQAPSEGIRSKSALAFMPSFMDVADNLQVRGGCEVDPGLRFSAMSHSDYNPSPAPYSEHRFPLPDVDNSRVWCHLGRNSSSPKLGVDHPGVMKGCREEMAEFYLDLEREMSQTSVESIQSFEDQGIKEKAALSELSQCLETHLRCRSKTTAAATKAKKSAHPKLAAGTCIDSSNKL